MGHPDSKLLMDANTTYCEKHKVFQMLEGLMNRLIVERPEDPISFLVGALETDVKPRVVLASADSEVVQVQAKALAAATGLVHVDAETVRNTIVSSGVGAEAKAHLDKGEPIPGDLVVQAITQRLLANDCQQSGWVLTSAPNTLEQAQLFCAMGNLPTLYVHLDAPPDRLIQRICLRRYDPDDPSVGAPYHLERNPPADAAVLARLKQRPEDSEAVVREHIAQHERVQRQMAPLFASLAYRVDASADDAAALSSKLVALLSAPAPSRAPRPAPAVALVGPPGSGTAVQAALLAAQFGVVLVSAEQLVDEAVARGTAVGLKAKVYKETNTQGARTDGGRGLWVQPCSPPAQHARETSALTPGFHAPRPSLTPPAPCLFVARPPAPARAVPDMLVCSLIVERLSSEDCRRHGWILEGFPNTSAQAAALAEQRVVVRDLIALELADAAALAEVTGRRIDPETGKAYHLARMPAGASTALMQRLLQHPRDTAEVASRRLGAWNAGKASLIAQYAAAARRCARARLLWILLPCAPCAPLCELSPSALSFSAR